MRSHRKKTAVEVRLCVFQKICDFEDALKPQDDEDDAEVVSAVSVLKEDECLLMWDIVEKLIIPFGLD